MRSIRLFIKYTTDLKKIRDRIWGSNTTLTRQLFKCCLGWCLACASTTVNAGPNTPMRQADNSNCTVNIANARDHLEVIYAFTSRGTNSRLYTFLGFAADLANYYSSLPPASGTQSYSFALISMTQPIEGTPSPSSGSGSMPDNTTFYLILGGGPNGESCVYQITTENSLITAATVSAFLPANTAGASATHIPVFTPMGMTITIGGLLWFGRRRKLKVTHTPD